MNSHLQILAHAHKYTHECTHTHALTHTGPDTSVCSPFSSHGFVPEPGVWRSPSSPPPRTVPGSGGTRRRRTRPGRPVPRGHLGTVQRTERDGGSPVGVTGSRTPTSPVAWCLSRGLPGSGTRGRHVPETGGRGEVLLSSKRLDSGGLGGPTTDREGPPGGAGPKTSPLGRGKLIWLTVPRISPSWSGRLRGWASTEDGRWSRTTGDGPVGNQGLESTS